MEPFGIFGSSVFLRTSVYMAVGHALLIPLLGRSGPLGPCAARAARLLLAIPVLVVSAWTAGRLWLVSLPSFGQTSQEERLFGPHSFGDDAEWLTLLAFSYHIIDLAVLVTHAVASTLGKAQPLPEVGTMLAHHVVTALLAYHSLRFSFLQFYGIFYVGVAECSSVPLAAMNLLRMASESSQPPGSWLPKLNSAMRVCFAISFLVVRGPWWLYVNCRFYSDTAPLLLRAEGPVAERLASHGMPRVHVVCWLFANALLTLLQLHWGSRVLRGLVRAVQRKRDE
eukprot:gb/GFBE01019004.1/.p1 GENE.gb/GFBE01019004.1/~~gb/GFBE01019004.1/.p1  ORF type:complete len:282 (+),score=24.30 gb/GFBE01019004.1/:1-846(+)